MDKKQSDAYLKLIIQEGEVTDFKPDYNELETGEEPADVEDSYDTIYDELEAEDLDEIDSNEFDVEYNDLETGEEPADVEDSFDTLYDELEGDELDEGVASHVLAGLGGYYAGKKIADKAHEKKEKKEKEVKESESYKDKLLEVVDKGALTIDGISISRYTKIREKVEKMSEEECKTLIEKSKI